MKAPKRSTKEHKCLCAISTWESAITFGSDIKSDRYIKGMMDGFPYRSDHENVWRMYSHAEMRSKGRTDGHTEMTRDEGKKCPMINGPRTHDKWSNDPWKMDQWSMINGPAIHDKWGWEEKIIIRQDIFCVAKMHDGCIFMQKWPVIKARNVLW